MYIDVVYFVIIYIVLIYLHIFVSIYFVMIYFVSDILSKCLLSNIFCPIYFVSVYFVLFPNINANACLLIVYCILPQKNESTRKYCKKAKTTLSPVRPFDGKKLWR